MQPVEKVIKKGAPPVEEEGGGGESVSFHGHNKNKTRNKQTIKVTLGLCVSQERLW